MFIRFRLKSLVVNFVRKLKKELFYFSKIGFFSESLNFFSITFKSGIYANPYQHSVSNNKGFIQTFSFLKKTFGNFINLYFFSKLFMPIFAGGISIFKLPTLF